MATFSLQPWLFLQAVALKKQMLCCSYSDKSNKLVEIGPVQGWEPVWIVGAYLVGNLTRQAQPHGRRVLSSQRGGDAFYFGLKL